MSTNYANGTTNEHGLTEEMENGEWKMENGEWKMENSELNHPTRRGTRKHGLTKEVENGE